MNLGFSSNLWATHEFNCPTQRTASCGFDITTKNAAQYEFIRQHPYGHSSAWIADPCIILHLGLIYRLRFANLRTIAYCTFLHECAWISNDAPTIFWQSLRREVSPAWVIIAKTIVNDSVMFQSLITDYLSKCCVSRSPIHYYLLTLIWHGFWMRLIILRYIRHVASLSCIIGLSGWTEITAWQVYEVTLLDPVGAEAYSAQRLHLHLHLILVLLAWFD